MSSWAEAKWISDNIISHIDQRAMTIQPNDMKKFEIRNISDSSAGLKFLEPDDIRSGGHVICKTKGVMIRMSTKDYPQTINDGDLVLVNTDIGKYNQEEYVVNGLSKDAIYYFTAFPFSTDNVYNMSQSDLNKVKTNTMPIYGIQRDITSSSPYWTRTHFAKGLSATASEGTIAGHSDFDNIYPWSDMKRTTIDTNEMVKIPLFHYRRYREGNIEHIDICQYSADGFSEHPGSGRFVGAYITSDYSYKEHAQVGSNRYKTPYLYTDMLYQLSQTWDIGRYWRIIDIKTVSALQMLFLVEFACNNSQRIIGKVGLTDKYKETGECENVPNLTGIYTDLNGVKTVIYRGIENIWGNNYTWVDCVAKSWRSIYFSKKKSSIYNINNYEIKKLDSYQKASYHISENGYISQLGLDKNAPWLLLPEDAAGSDSTYFCDKIENKSDSTDLLKNFVWGGEGLFSFKISYISEEDKYNTPYFSRLLYDPHE